MKQNQLGKSELFVSEIGLGCMSFQSEQQQTGTRVIEEAIDRGINFFDTADLYEYGLNEQLVGSALKGKRQDIILATKVGNRWNEDKQGWHWDPSKSYIKTAVKESLQRLQTDYLDLYQLHGGTIEDPIDETIEAFEELQKEGLIRYYGISSIRPNVIREYTKKSNIVSVMMQYSIFDRRPEEEMLNFLHENEISVIARGPVARGLLTDKWQKKVVENGYLDYSKAEVETLIEKIETLPVPLLSTALSYVLTPKAVATAIPGARTVEQLEEIVNAYEETLSNEQREQIKAWAKASVYEAHR